MPALNVNPGVTVSGTFSVTFGSSRWLGALAGPFRRIASSGLVFEVEIADNSREFLLTAGGRPSPNAVGIASSGQWNSG